MANSPPSHDDYPRPRGGFLLLIMAVVALLGIGAWFVFKPEGLLQQVTEERVEKALLNNGVPMPMAGCMAPRLTDRLTIDQLRNLEKMAPEKGESTFPMGPNEALTRLRRVGDDEAVEQLVRVAAGCGIRQVLGG